MKALEQRGFEYGVYHFYSETQDSLLQVLKLKIPLTEAFLHELISLGAVYLEGHREVDSQTIAPKGAYIRVHTKPRRYKIEERIPSPNILGEGTDYVVVHKPSTIPCHPTVDNVRENLLFRYKKLLNKPLYLTHRLDVCTEGILILALTKGFQKYFNELLKNHQVYKTYKARVHSHLQPPLGVWKHWMKTSPRAPKTVQSNLPPSGEESSWKECLLEVQQCEKKSPQIWELQIHLITGRTHQIRAQCQSQGCPIQGDVLYGASSLSSEESIELCAVETFFEDLDGNKVLFNTKPHWLEE